MVMHTSHRGFKEWIVQRISALIIASYVLVLIAYCLSFPHMSYQTWMHLYHSEWMRIYTILTLTAVLWHAWIGLWTVFTDYIKVKAIRILLETAVFLLLLTYLVWCLDILWA